MEIGNLVRYKWPELPFDEDTGYLMYLDTNEVNEVFYVIKWSSGEISEEPEQYVHCGIISVIQ